MNFSSSIDSAAKHIERKKNRIFLFLATNGETFRSHPRVFSFNEQRVKSKPIYHIVTRFYLVIKIKMTKSFSGVTFKIV